VNKKCTKCKKVKPIEAFTKRHIGNIGYHSWCRDCSNKQNIKRRKSNKEKRICIICGKNKTEEGFSKCRICLDASNQKRRLDYIKNKTIAIKLLGGVCKKCGLSSNIVTVYDFHHIENNKENQISVILQNPDWDIVRLELKKCELLCANCHRIVHWELQGKDQYEDMISELKEDD